MRRLCIAALMLLGLAGAANADGELDAKMTAADKARLAAYATTRAEAIAEAKSGGSPADIAVLDKILETTASASSRRFRSDRQLEMPDHQTGRDAAAHDL